MTPELVTRAQQGDREAMNQLVAEYAWLARMIAADFFDRHGDHDDLHQEALIGIFKAVRSWRPGHQMGFRNFVAMCVRRHVFTYIKTATRGKHLALTNAVRAAVNDDGEAIDATELIEAPHGEPSEELAIRAELALLLDVIRYQLSPLERASLIGFANGDSYAEIEASLVDDHDRVGRAKYTPVKVVDNALTRARRKIAFALEEHDALPLDVAA